jgi:hypothetical protein
VDGAQCPGVKQQGTIRSYEDISADQSDHARKALASVNHSRKGAFFALVSTSMVDGIRDTAAITPKAIVYTSMIYGEWRHA